MPILPVDRHKLRAANRFWRNGKKKKLRWAASEDYLYISISLDTFAWGKENKLIQMKAPSLASCHHHYEHRLTWSPLLHSSLESPVFAEQSLRNEFMIYLCLSGCPRSCGSHCHGLAFHLTVFIFQACLLRRLASSESAPPRIIRSINSAPFVLHNFALQNGQTVSDFEENQRRCW